MAYLTGAPGGRGLLLAVAGVTHSPQTLPGGSHCIVSAWLFLRFLRFRILRFLRFLRFLRTEKSRVCRQDERDQFYDAVVNLAAVSRRLPPCKIHTGHARRILQGG